MSDEVSPQAHQCHTKARYDLHGFQGAPRKQASHRGCSRADAISGIPMDVWHSTHASRDPPPPRAPVGAQFFEFMPSVGNVLVYSEEEETLH